MKIKIKIFINSLFLFQSGTKKQEEERIKKWSKITQKIFIDFLIGLYYSVDKHLGL